MKITTKDKQETEFWSQYTSIKKTCLQSFTCKMPINTYKIEWLTFKNPASYI
jgi:hypothetical protein